jgi:hypothetical protein
MHSRTVRTNSSIHPEKGVLSQRPVWRITLSP